MITIQCTQFQKTKLLRILIEKIEQFQQEYANKKITKEMMEYEIKEIQDLIDRVNGKVTNDDLLLTSWKYSSNHESTKEEKKDDLPKSPFDLL